MKNLKRLCVALALTLLLALSAFAGNMTTMNTPPFTEQTTPQGEMSTMATDQTDSSTTTALATEVALKVLSSVLSLF